MANRIDKVVIFAGGRGTRLAELTDVTPKPLVEIGGEPIIIHIMRHFYRHGYREFIIPIGYRSMDFKRFFRDYLLKNRDVTFNGENHDTMTVHQPERTEDWVVHLVETGLNSDTGQRLHYVRDYIGGEPFFLTYGDTLSDVDLHEVEEAHFSRPEGNLATLTAATKGERFGVLDIGDQDDVGTIRKFSEKTAEKSSLINGGFMACNPEILDRVDENTGDFSHETMTDLSLEGKMSFYAHYGFWHPMDSKNDHNKLEELYLSRPELF